MSYKGKSDHLRPQTSDFKENSLCNLRSEGDNLRSEVLHGLCDVLMVNFLRIDPTWLSAFSKASVFFRLLAEIGRPRRIPGSASPVPWRSGPHEYLGCDIFTHRNDKTRFALIDGG